MENCKHEHKDFVIIHGAKYEFCAYCGEVFDKVEDKPQSDEGNNENKESHI